MTRVRADCVIYTLVFAGFVHEARADWQVWTITETLRVLREDPARTGASPKLFAARNEWESFQILMRSDAVVKAVNVEPADLRSSTGGLLPAADTRLYRQHQLQLTLPTYRNDKFKPGWYPDPLIPFRHPLTRRPLDNAGAKLRAVPFDLPMEQTHGFWVDVYVPPEAVPGEYHGTYRVTAEGRDAVEIPVSLTVWNFVLPRVSQLRTALGSPALRMRSHYRDLSRAGKEKEPSDWAAVEEQCAEMLTRHRINATPGAGSIEPVAQPDGSYRIPREQVLALREFIDRYHVAE